MKHLKRTNFKKRGYSKVVLMTCLTFFALAGCDKDDDDDPPIMMVNEEELITTAILTLVDQATSDSVEFRFTDLDGDGGNAPVISGGTLAASTAYTGSIQLWNEIEGEDITLEVMEEDLEHQFFYNTGSSGITWAYADQDSLGNPLGVETTWMTAAATTDAIMVTLRHMPDKNGAGVSGGDITNAGGDTDIEVSLPVTVQ